MAEVSAANGSSTRAYRPDPRRRKYEISVMDIIPSYPPIDPPIESRCYTPADISEAMLEPAPSAEYTCRWIHLHPPNRFYSDFITFKSFMETVNDLMGNYSEAQRQRVRAHLRGFQRENETRGSHSSSFRPTFACFGNRTEEGIKRADPQATPASSEPIFASLPAIRLLRSRFNQHHALLSLPVILMLKSGLTPHEPIPRDIHQEESLLQYHYRFSYNAAQESFGEVITTVLGIGDDMKPGVSELWCLRVDNKNLITVSHDKGSSIWPFGRMPNESLPVTMDSEIALSAKAEYFDFDRQAHTPLATPLARIPVNRWWAPLIFLVVAVVHLSFRASAWLVPGGWMMTGYLQEIERQHLGIDVITFLRIVSFWLSQSEFLFQSQARREGHEDGGRRSPFSRLFRLFSRSVGSPQTRLVLLGGGYYKHWAEIESTIRAQAGPSEDIFDALRRLWIIAVHFRANFYSAEDGNLYLIRDSWSASAGLLDFVRRRFISGKPTPPNNDPLQAIRLPFRPRHTVWMGETLRDLDDRFEEAVKNLNKTLGATDESVQELRNQEDKFFLDSIWAAGSEPALACMLRMCTINTPSRFSVTARDISDSYARKLAQQEWLMRDSVNQSLIYQIATVEDELRVLRNILHSQQDVITQLAGYISTVLNRDVLAVTAPQSFNDASESKPEPRLVRALKRKSQLEHRRLLSEVERHEDTVGRLKSQAALLINVKAEGQGVAIFVFTIVTVIFLPLSFATSYLGMNTSDIRDLEQGQWLLWAIGGPLTVCVVLIAWLVARRGPKWRSDRQNRKLMDIEDWKWGYQD